MRQRACLCQVVFVGAFRTIFISFCLDPVGFRARLPPLRTTNPGEKSTQWTTALHLVSQMAQRSIQMDTVVYSAVISALAQVPTCAARSRKRGGREEGWPVQERGDS